LLCLALAPRWLRTTSDGFVIGAMAGLGFAVIEFATSFALDNFPQNGWLDLATSVPSRWNLGTQHHILWAAVTGGAIGRWRESPRSAGAIVFAVTAIAVVIGTHSLQDLYGKYLGPLSIGLIGAPLVQLGLTEDMMALGHPVSILLMFTGAMINFLLINLPVFGFLLAHLRRMRRSGSFA
jgi:RsiW-degrading membrane proteinase PrsW (M82 family)